MTSKSQVNRCGDLLRDNELKARAFTAPELHDARKTVRDFRQEFQYPMTTVAMGLRQFIVATGTDPVVAQRLKRLPQIVKKLARYPKTKLARMEDIGGCRAVLPDRDSVAAVLSRIDHNWKVVRHRDYVEAPKASGYRGVHVVVERDDHRVEIQLRTPYQQEWAETVETVAGRLELPLKDGKGPDEVLDFFRLAADGMAMAENRVVPPDGFMDRFHEARERFLEYANRPRR